METSELTILPDEFGNNNLRPETTKSLLEEQVYLKEIFPTGVLLSYSLESGHWNANGTLDSSILPGGQRFTCQLRAASGYSRAGTLHGFSVWNLTVNGVETYRDTNNSFRS